MNTPTPVDDCDSILYDANGVVLADMTTTPIEQRREIVRAVNNHERLVGALERLERWISFELRDMRPNDNPVWARNLEMARAALAAVEESE